MGGSGRTVMRAVSFLGPGEGDIPGACVAATGAPGAGIDLGADPETEGAGAGVLLGKKGGGVTAFEGAGGKGVCAVGGRRGAPPDEGGGIGAGRTGGAPGCAVPFPGGRGGRLIRTVSRGDVPEAEAGVPGRGGKVMRTVSFLGSFESAI
ncbi:MAG: hypothetical protein QOH39_1442 [Verrucomicrobiota bacterium]|jgi:hypothetical protein